MLPDRLIHPYVTTFQLNAGTRRRDFYVKIPAYNYLLARKDAATLGAVPASFPRFVSFSDPRRPRSICASYTREFQLYKCCALVSIWRDVDYAPRYQQQLIRLFKHSVLLPVYTEYLIFTAWDIERERYK